MNRNANGHNSEAAALAAVEAARQKEWLPSFLQGLFVGSYRLNLLEQVAHPPERPEFRDIYQRLKTFLEQEVDPAEIDQTGEYPPHVLDGLRKLGMMGMTIGTEYGGLGLSQVEYDSVMKLLGGRDGNLVALLSAHQSIGVPQPLKLFGTEEQRQRYFPRIAAGAISAFALTEPNAGSDPSTVEATVERDASGDYILNGGKLWCTNGTLAEVILVMARHPDSGKISAFIVEMDWPGVKVVRRCRFLGLKALANAVLSFENVRIPAANLVGREGQGLKIALTTLNTGRLAIPAASAGVVKACLAIVRTWSKERVQWGQPIGQHEAVAGKLADIVSHAFAMEAVSDLSSRLANSGEFDIRLEAAAAKEFNTFWGWQLIDDTLQIRGGRGYENERSLEARGEASAPVERMLRDFRVNRIFEGSSEIMHLFLAREAMDYHMQRGNDLITPGTPFGKKVNALFKLTRHYGVWYPKQWLPAGRPRRYRDYGRLAGHLRYAERASQTLARTTFHGLMIYRVGIQKRQLFLFRIVDIGLDLYAMTAAVLRARSMRAAGHPDWRMAETLADLFCRTARRRIRELFHDLWYNDDGRKYRVAQQLLAGDFEWLEKGSVDFSDIVQPKAPVSGAKAE